MDVLDLLKLRLEEAEDEVRRLRAPIAALEPGDTQPAVTHQPAPGTVAATTHGLGRRRRRTVTPEELLELIPTEGIARVELDALTGAPGGMVLVALKQLETDGRARREGERGATRWYPVT
jgi:hypothetical protein